MRRWHGGMSVVLNTCNGPRKEPCPSPSMVAALRLQSEGGEPVRAQGGGGLRAR